ncbi:Tetratricopeptide repeat-containing protein [Asanoa hainanensis]|uniref:Tetratricopeptide repeat-containing protein n=1 Tax=Asanoa hainanensis TaxID=560556 RepID=A0A239LI17_9ACTN|nr:tetratricopeptide repeat protein [Asanoa hainanensis]SNT29194.1 Tetratricopeptide repeat-containing protein [Asanoa hainanensis]
MSIGLGDLTTRAQDRIHAGDLAGAEELLGSALATADPSPSTATDELALAAALQAKVLLSLGEAHGARGWASYAYSATTRLYGAHDPRTVDTATTFAAVLHRVHAHERAARLYHDVILELSAAEGPESARVLAVHADLATVEYARGDCAAARARLEDAWEMHREVYGDDRPAGIRMLAKLGAMERDCGRLDASHAHLALAQELCRTHLPPDHPLIAQVAALARAAADPNHVCAVEDSERVATAGSGPPPPRSPISPAGTGYARPFTPVPEHIPPVVPQPMTPPPVAPTPVAPPPVAPAPVTPTLSDGFGSGSALDGDDAGPVGPRHAADDEVPDRFAPGSDLRDAYATETYPPDTEPPPEAWSPPAQRAPERPLWPDEAQPGNRTGWAQHASDQARSEWARQREPTPGDEVWRRQESWDSTSSETWDDPGGEGWDDGTGWYARPDDEAWAARRHDDERWAQPSAESEEPPEPEPNQNWDRAAWGTDPGAALLPEADPTYPRQLEAGEEAERRAARLPERRLSGLAVPDRRPRRRVTPLVVAGLLVVVLGAVAVIAGFALIDRDGTGTGSVAQPTTARSAPATSTAPPPTTASPTARPGTPPSGVALDDGTDQVTLRWKYPVGADGTVVVSAGRTGQQARPIEQLPAGSDNFVVYGLDPTSDYCFVVGVNYPAGVVGRAKPVCTDRG